MLDNEDKTKARNNIITGIKQVSNTAISCN